VNISVCPDVVGLRGVTKNGKLGQYYIVIMKPLFMMAIGLSTGEIRVSVRGG